MRWIQRTWQRAVSMVRPGTSTDVASEYHEPWWVRWITDGGRPIVAVIVMTMCAPGEHHLGVMAGWSDKLAWGMASVLAAYAGIAAVVASRRRKGMPGRISAIFGAWLALGAAMAAQPISHLFVTGHWLGDPAWLVVSVSCVPPLVLGHLLHLAAMPRLVRPTPTPEPTKEPVPEPVVDEIDEEYEEVVKQAMEEKAPEPEVTSEADSARGLPQWVTDRQAQIAAAQTKAEAKVHPIAPQLDARNLVHTFLVDWMKQGKTYDDRPTAVLYPIYVEAAKHQGIKPVTKRQISNLCRNEWERLNSQRMQTA